MKQYSLLSFSSNFSWKKILVLLPAPLLAQIEAVIYPLIGLLLVILADLFTALISYFYNRKKEKNRKLKIQDFRDGIVSGGLRQTAIKAYQYGMAGIVVFIIEVFGFGGQINFEVPLVHLDATLTQFVLWAFILIEFKSIDENLKGVSGKSFINSIVNIFTYFRGIISLIIGPKEKNLMEFDDDEDTRSPKH